MKDCLHIYWKFKKLKCNKNRHSKHPNSVCLEFLSLCVPTVPTWTWRVRSCFPVLLGRVFLEHLVHMKRLHKLNHRVRRLCLQPLRVLSVASWAEATLRPRNTDDGNMFHYIPAVKKWLLNFIYIIKSTIFLCPNKWMSCCRNKSSQGATVSGDVVQCGSGCGEAGAGLGVGGGGRGFGTGTGPVWAGLEGTGSVWAGTSCRLQPAAPNRPLTDASTWSWRGNTAARSPQQQDNNTNYGRPGGPRGKHLFDFSLYVRYLNCGLP